MRGGNQQKLCAKIAEQDIPVERKQQIPIHPMHENECTPAQSNLNPTYNAQTKPGMKKNTNPNNCPLKFQISRLFFSRAVGSELRGGAIVAPLCNSNTNLGTSFLLSVSRKLSVVRSVGRSASGICRLWGGRLPIFSPPIPQVPLSLLLRNSTQADHHSNQRKKWKWT